MRRSNITACFKADRRTVWDIVTDNENYGWRSDLAKVEISPDGNSFTEFTKDGYQTNFTITVKEPYNRYEFDMENMNFKGHWVGLFSQTPNNGTKIDFTEELHIKSKVMELLSYLFMNIKKMQAIYVADLRKKLGEQE